MQAQEEESRLQETLRLAGLPSTHSDSRQEQHAGSGSSDKGSEDGMEELDAPETGLDFQGQLAARQAAATENQRRRQQQERSARGKSARGRGGRGGR